MHVGMEETGADRLGEEGQHQPLGDQRQTVPGCLQRRDIADLDPVDPCDGEHAPVGTVPVDFRNRVALKAGHRGAELAGRGGFAPQIELAHGPAAEILDRQPRAQPHGLAAERLEMGGGPFIGLDVAREGGGGCRGAAP